MAINIVKYGNNTLIDLTPTTAQASDVASGKVFFDRSGTQTTGTASGGGATVKTGSKSNSSNTATTLAFTGLTAQPKAWAVRLSTTVTSSGSTTYYYIIDMMYDGTNTRGNYFRVGSTRSVTHDTTHYSWTYSNGTLTLSSSASRTTAGGSFYNGTYELIYAY